LNPWITLTSVAALVFYFLTSVNVATQRTKHDVQAPAMSGHPMVERALRVQGNTLEWLVIFLPSLWLFSLYWSAYLAAGLGALWVIGRILYMVGYMRDVRSRAPGFGVQAAATLVLLLGAAIGGLLAAVRLLLVR
jgi:uncharacterized membrane protein YecN with MAPEG domain